MGPILEDIKRVFNDYKMNGDDDGNVCNLNPFDCSEWMYDYLFPEVLLVKNEYLIWNDPEYFKYIDYNMNDWGGDFLFPCNVCSEEQILRIMAEHGLL